MNVEKEVRELRELWAGFWTSRIVLTANNLGIFDHLRTSRTAEETAGLIQADTRGTEILLNALTGLGLLRKMSGKYRNADMAKRFLVKRSPYYQGDMIRHADTLWRNWSFLDEVVKTGKPARRAQDHASFIRGMHNNSVFRAGKVVRELDLKGVRRALDLGGGPGTYSMELARKGISVSLFDLPDTISIAREIANEAGAVGISFLSGDFFADDIGRAYDLIFISQVLHSFSPEDNRFILKKCLNALQPAGKIVIQEFSIDNSLTCPLHGALFSVNMLVNTDGGRCYAPQEIIRWLTETGFRKYGKKLLEDTVLVFGSV
jgi:2-polyprenyl-3-methyl-5-hydroxy-6-metoxy-1,4-benzoquinol methylase